MVTRSPGALYFRGLHARQGCLDQAAHPLQGHLDIRCQAYVTLESSAIFAPNQGQGGRRNDRERVELVTGTALDPFFSVVTRASLKLSRIKRNMV